jgi:uncharacterized protein YndB with AHSA1/START domain
MSRATLRVTTPTDREILVTRVFDAPRALVWDAMTRPELLKRWLSGPPGWSMVVCENDLKAGGAFRCDWRGPDEADMRMRGVYREIVTLERIVRTEIFEWGCEAQACEQLGTLVLTEEDGDGGKGGRRTVMSITLLFPSKEARDASLASGMEQGMEAGYQRLDGILASAVGGRDKTSAA